MTANPNGSDGPASGAEAMLDRLFTTERVDLAAWGERGWPDAAGATDADDDVVTPAWQASR